MLDYTIFVIFLTSVILLHAISYCIVFHKSRMYCFMLFWFTSYDLILRMMLSTCVLLYVIWLDVAWYRIVESCRVRSWSTSKLYNVLLYVVLFYIV